MRISIIPSDGFVLFTCCMFLIHINKKSINNVNDVISYSKQFTIIDLVKYAIQVFSINPLFKSNL